ncbi:exopolysaccharide biosynthesis protein [Sphingomonas baiyangensis]|uniref:Exopolysaccharide biosynthesis protein n=2 Tax=Sphingomonas baiyangensis TaxID=2572576 RepID=A0A4U1L723_9SPHN|nr:exopolysaccharide biosynthesis protein [Sphingomonas baiyangensis]
MADDGDFQSVGEILDAMRDLGEKQDRVAVGDLFETFGQRSHGPALLVPALIEISPIGAIPGVPTALAIILILFAVQIMLDRDHLWLPGLIERRSVRGERVQGAADKLRGVGRFLDRWFHGRLTRFTDGIWMRVAAGCVIVLALTVPALELFPFASTAPMAAIAAFGLALLMHDGALMLFAYGVAAAALAGGAAIVVSG